MTVTKIAAPEVIWQEAVDAGYAASLAAKPQPMIVGTATTPFGNEIDYSKKVYFESEGMCGFGWVKIRPARGPLVAYLKRKGIGHKGYQGGWEVSAHYFSPNTQSYERNVAAAAAVAKVFQSYGITAYGQGRLD